MATILVVDDEKNYLWTIEELLRGEGFDVATCEKGAEALNGAEDDGRGRRRVEGAPGDAPRRRARGERRRPGRLRELRHPRAGAGGGRRLTPATASRASSYLTVTVAEAFAVLPPAFAVTFAT